MKFIYIILITALFSNGLLAQKLKFYPLKNSCVSVVNFDDNNLASLSQPSFTVHYQSQDSILYAIDSGKLVKDIYMEEENSRIILQKVNDSIFIVYSGIKNYKLNSLQNKNVLAEEPLAVAQKNAYGMYEVGITLYCRTKAIKIEQEEIFP